MIEVVCSNCGSEFEKIKAEVNEEYDYCSSECYHEHLSDRYSGEDNPSYSNAKSVVECSFCNGEVEKYDRYLENVDNTFCSEDCRSKWVSENFEGENNGNWRGGRNNIYYGPNWKKKRVEALQDSNFECEECGMDNNAHISEFGLSLDVHHKSPLKSFESTQEANGLDNLKVLCKYCHAEAESEGL